MSSFWGVVVPAPTRRLLAPAGVEVGVDLKNRSVLRLFLGGRERGAYRHRRSGLPVLWTFYPREEGDLGEKAPCLVKKLAKRVAFP